MKVEEFTKRLKEENINKTKKTLIIPYPRFLELVEETKNES